MKTNDVAAVIQQPSVYIFYMKCLHKCDSFICVEDEVLYCDMIIRFSK